MVCYMRSADVDSSADNHPNNHRRNGSNNGLTMGLTECNNEPSQGENETQRQQFFSGDSDDFGKSGESGVSGESGDSGESGNDPNNHLHNGVVLEHWRVAFFSGKGYMPCS